MDIEIEINYYVESKNSLDYNKKECRVDTISMKNYKNERMSLLVKKLQKNGKKLFLIKEREYGEDRGTIIDIDMTIGEFVKKYGIFYHTYNKYGDIILYLMHSNKLNANLIFIDEDSDFFRGYSIKLAKKNK